MICVELWVSQYDAKYQGVQRYKEPYLLQMRRLLARPARGSHLGRWSRQNLLKLLFVVTSAVVLAFIGWGFVDTARVKHSATMQLQSNETDFGHLANVVLANDTFPSDSLVSQLQSYIIPNANLRGNDWDQINDAVNSSCPVKYNRLK